MSDKKTTYIQRIQPGLPVLAMAKDDVLVLHTRDKDRSEMGRIPLSEPTEDKREFDATLEAFLNGQRLDANRIRETGFKSLASDERINLRLVLNHDDSDNPLVEAGFYCERLEVASRPTLSDEVSRDAMRLASDIPCEQVRTYRRGEDGMWTIDTDEPVLADRSARIAPSIPKKPIARPFTAPVSATADCAEGLLSYRMTSEGKT